MGGGFVRVELGEYPVNLGVDGGRSYSPGWKRRNRYGGMSFHLPATSSPGRTNLTHGLAHRKFRYEPETPVKEVCQKLGISDATFGLDTDAVGAPVLIRTAADDRVIVQHRIARTPAMERQQGVLAHPAQRMNVGDANAEYVTRMPSLVSNEPGNDHESATWRKQILRRDCRGLNSLGRQKDSEPIPPQFIAKNQPRQSGLSSSEIYWSLQTAKVVALGFGGPSKGSQLARLR